jgi:transposase
MSLEYEPIAPVPSQTRRVALAAFPKGNPYLTLRDELGPIFSDLDFVGLFSKTGKPAGLSSSLKLHSSPIAQRAYFKADAAS